jgi:hypothetical protein
MWLRHDWQNWLRPDWQRFMPPDPGPSMRERLWQPYREEPPPQRSATGLTEADIIAFRCNLAALRFKLALIKGALRLKVFNPNQPRVPAGNPDGGQWTDAGGGTGFGSGRTRLADAGGGNDPQVMSDATPDNYWKPGARLAQDDRSGQPVDLQEERSLGGHTIEGHVGKEPEFLFARVRERALLASERGDVAEGLRVGSFSSLESANKLVNSTLARNRAVVDQVASGARPRANVDAEFGSVTGQEAYARNERSQPYIRETYGVRVVIVPDRRAPKRFRVETAFPTNFDR